MAGHGRAWQERLVTPYIMWAVSVYRAGGCRIGVVEVGLGLGSVKNRIGRSDLRATSKRGHCQTELGTTPGVWGVQIEA